jgi:hypothetical protein
MIWRRKTSGPGNSVTDTELVPEIEAFLQGTYQQRLELRDISVPEWVRFNALAHGSLEDLHRLAARPEVNQPSYLCCQSEKGWKVAQAVIANEMIELVAGSVSSLQRIQMRLLMPLEACLMEEKEFTALDLVIVTQSVLRLMST